MPEQVLDRAGVRPVEHLGEVMRGGDVWRLIVKVMCGVNVWR